MEPYSFTLADPKYQHILDAYYAFLAQKPVESFELVSQQEWSWATPITETREAIVWFNGFHYRIRERAGSLPEGGNYRATVHNVIPTEVRTTIYVDAN